MSNCPKCRIDLVPAANFCHACGHGIKAFCRACRIDLPENSDFCFRCGDAIWATMSDVSTGFVPKKDSIVARPQPNIPQPDNTRQVDTQIEGERKLVSIVFADISGFTAMSEKMDPERVTDIINQCFQRLGKKVYESEGYIDKFMGDCIMALFGAPIAHENDPELAINCAIEMLKELAVFNKENGLDLGMSIGINSGLVVAGGVGTDQKLEYTVMGDAVNLAQRIQSAANRQEILVSRSIFSACEKIFDFETLEPIRVKGKEHPVAVFSIKGRRDLHSQQQRRSQKVQSLIGREREIELAEKLLHQSAQGRGQIFFVSGEAGVGKSRFKLETKEKAIHNKMIWLEGRCRLLNRETAYYPFIQILQHYLEINIESNLTDQLAKFNEIRSLMLDEISVSLLLDLMNLPNPDCKTIQLDAAQKRRAMFLAIKKCLYAISKRRPLCLYIEDLHWADPLSLELLSQIADGIQSLPLLIYASFRSDFQHNWSGRTNLTQISLEPLNSDQSLRLAREILQVKELPESFQALIIQKADGNPLYIEEIIKTLMDSGKISIDDGSCKIAVDMDSVKIPATLQGLIAARIDKLTDKTKQVLQYASVIGREFSDLLLSKASELENELHDSLRYLRKKELIFELTEEIDEIIYIFKHALTQEVAYESILKKKRRYFHERVAKTIETICSDTDSNRLEENLEPLAYHYEKAEIGDKAIHYLILSAKKMSQSYNNDAAIKNYESALKWIEKTSKPDIDLIIQTTYNLGEVLILKADFDGAEASFLRIKELAEQKKDDKLVLARCYRRLGDIQRMRGVIDKALDLLHESELKAKEANDFEGEIRTYKAFGSVFQISHQLDKALEYLEKGLEGAKSLENSKLIAEYLNDISIVHINRNELQQAETYLRESIEIASHDSSLRPLFISSTLNLGVISYYLKDFPAALSKFKEASHVAQQIGDLRNILISKHNIGEIQKEFGQFDDALLTFEECYDLALDMGNELEEINNHILIAHMKHNLNLPDEAKQILEEEIQRCEERKFVALQCDALYYLAVLELDTGNVLKAREALQRSLYKAKELHIAHAQERATQKILEIDNEATLMGERPS